MAQYFKIITALFILNCNIFINTMEEKCTHKINRAWAGLDKFSNPTIYVKRLLAIASLLEIQHHLFEKIDTSMNEVCLKKKIDTVIMKINDIKSIENLQIPEFIREYFCGDDNDTNTREIAQFCLNSIEQEVLPTIQQTLFNSERIRTIIQNEPNNPESREANRLLNNLYTNISELIWLTLHKIRNPVLRDIKLADLIKLIIEHKERINPDIFKWIHNAAKAVQDIDDRFLGIFIGYIDNITFIPQQIAYIIEGPLGHIPQLIMHIRYTKRLKELNNEFLEFCRTTQPPSKIISKCQEFHCNVQALLNDYKPDIEKIAQLYQDIHLALQQAVIHLRCHDSKILRDAYYRLPRSLQEQQEQLELSTVAATPEPVPQTPATTCTANTADIDELLAEPNNLDQQSPKSPLSRRKKHKKRKKRAKKQTSPEPTPEEVMHAQSEIATKPTCTYSAEYLSGADTSRLLRISKAIEQQEKAIVELATSLHEQKEDLTAYLNSFIKDYSYLCEQEYANLPYLDHIRTIIKYCQDYLLDRSDIYKATIMLHLKTKFEEFELNREVLNDIYIDIAHKLFLHE